MFWCFSVSGYKRSFWCVLNEWYVEWSTSYSHLHFYSSLHFAYYFHFFQLSLLITKSPPLPFTPHFSLFHYYSLFLICLCVVIRISWRRAYILHWLVLVWYLGKARDRVHRRLLLCSDLIILRFVELSLSGLELVIYLFSILKVLELLGSTMPQG